MRTMAKSQSNRSDPTDTPPPLGTLQNREVSWLAFNKRVLEEAVDPKNPMLERLRFLSIFQTNLDEFFMVRVSGLQQQVDAGVEAVSVDGLSARGQLSQIRSGLRPMLATAQATLATLLVEMASKGVQVVHYDDLRKSERKQWNLSLIHI